MAQHSLQHYQIQIIKHLICLLERQSPMPKVVFQVKWDFALANWRLTLMNSCWPQDKKKLRNIGTGNNNCCQLKVETPNSQSFFARKVVHSGKLSVFLFVLCPFIMSMRFGIDLCRIDRMLPIYTRHGHRFLQKMLHPHETQEFHDLCNSSSQMSFLATR